MSRKLFLTVRMNRDEREQIKAVARRFGQTESAAVRVILRTVAAKLLAAEVEGERQRLEPTREVGDGRQR